MRLTLKQELMRFTFLKENQIEIMGGLEESVIDYLP